MPKVKVDFEKSSFITKDEHEAFKLNKTKVQQKMRDRDIESGPPFLESISNTNGTESPEAKKSENHQQLQSNLRAVRRIFIE